MRRVSGIRHSSIRFISSTNVKYAPRPSTLNRFSSNKHNDNLMMSKLPSNPQLSFPCLDKLEKKSELLQSEKNNLRSQVSLDSGPEPSYSKVQTGFEIFHSDTPIFLDYGGFLPEYQIAYESWGQLNKNKSNLILIHTGLSASSHAKSQAKNSKPGWWENFIGPNKYLDTEKYFVVCTNVIGGCYGSTGPSSVDPADGERYATRFPILSVNDMVRAQHRLITERFGVSKIHASIGASMGGMQSLAYAHEFPDSVNKVISISGCARSHPYSIAMRHTQRQVLMADPNWNRGFYYDSIPPHIGMKLSREIATVTYRSGPEWEIRFGRDRADPSKPPALCPDFLVETYLDHAGEKFCLEYDPNSLLYISKAMDLFDLGYKNRSKAKETRQYLESQSSTKYDVDGVLKFEPPSINDPSSASCALPSSPYTEKPRVRESPEDSQKDLVKGMEGFSHKDVLVVGVESDILFPVWQQREIADVLKMNQHLKGEKTDNIKYIELSNEVSMYGHDTFLLSLDHIGKPVKEFLEK